MLPKKRIPTHPGEVLNEEFLKPLGMIQVALAAHVGVPGAANQRACPGEAGCHPGDRLAAGRGFAHHARVRREATRRCPAILGRRRGALRGL